MRKKDLFDLTGKNVVITGGGGMLGLEHGTAIAGYGGVPILLDIDQSALEKNQTILKQEFGKDILILKVDITDINQVNDCLDKIVRFYGMSIDVLINNAARNPKVSTSNEINFSRFENFPAEQWHLDLNVGLGGAFNCSKIFGTHMAKMKKGGVIINISSDLGVIAPDQRLYKQVGVSDELQPVKPVTYSVVKHGLIGLTKYLATYWCEENIRCNTLSPGGVYLDQDDKFVENISKLIPLGRMAFKDEYQGAIVFLASDASSYMNGANLIIDGGRSVW
jgi:NAD(P)-dependent dehydrogenase (short-subunit alcohol dehydrogenase family)